MKIKTNSKQSKMQLHVLIISETDEEISKTFKQWVILFKHFPIYVCSSFSVIFTTQLPVTGSKILKITMCNINSPF